jgi:hypothetical protein
MRGCVVAALLLSTAPAHAEGRSLSLPTSFQPDPAPQPASECRLEIARTPASGRRPAPPEDPAEVRVRDGGTEAVLRCQRALTAGEKAQARPQLEGLLALVGQVVWAATRR